MRAEEDARRGMARRLHDDALQLLFAAGLDLEDAAGGGPGAAAARTRAVEALTDAEVVVAASSVATGHDEVPAEGLLLALERLAHTCAHQGGFTIAVDLTPGLAPGPYDALLYGIARELLTNVRRHAGATAVSLTLTSDRAGNTTLRVTDNGRGLAPNRIADAVAEGHVGLAAAGDRLARAGGSLTVAGLADGPGTTALVVVPATPGTRGAVTPPPRT